MAKPDLTPNPPPDVTEKMVGSPAAIRFVKSLQAELQEKQDKRLDKLEARIERAFARVGEASGILQAQVNDLARVLEVGKRFAKIDKLLKRIDKLDERKL